MVCMETGLKIWISSAVVTLKPLWKEEIKKCELYFEEF